MTIWFLPAQYFALTPFAFLLGAVLCALAWNPRLSQGLALLISALLAVGLAAVLRALAPDAALDWRYADWSIGARSGLALDALSGPVALIVAMIAVLGALVGWHGKPDGRTPALRLAWAGAACGAAFSTDWLEATAWLLAAGLALSALIALRPDPSHQSVAWAARVFVWQALAGGAVMLGLGLVFANAGGLEPDRVGVMLDGARRDPLAFVGVGLVSAGLAAFAGLAPLHGGAAGAANALRLDGASALLATGLVGFCCFLRIEGAFVAAWGTGMGVWLLSLGTLGAVWAAGQMAMANTLRGVALLAWPSQLGIALVGLVARGAQASVLHILASLIAVMGMLAAAHVLERAFGDLPMDRLHGVGRRAPIAAGAVVIAMLSLTGAPFTLGFVSRFGVMEAVVAEAGLLAAAGLVLTSVLGMLVAARMIQILFLTAHDGRAHAGLPGQAGARMGGISLPLALPLILLLALSLALVCLYFGLAQPPGALAAPAAILERLNGW